MKYVEGPHFKLTFYLPIKLFPILRNMNSSIFCRLLTQNDSLIIQINSNIRKAKNKAEKTTKETNKSPDSSANHLTINFSGSLDWNKAKEIIKIDFSTEIGRLKMQKRRIKSTALSITRINSFYFPESSIWRHQRLNKELCKSDTVTECKLRKQRTGEVIKNQKVSTGRLFYLSKASSKQSALTSK